MKYKLSFLLLTVLFLTSCGSENTPQVEILTKSKKAEIDSLLNRYLDLERFSGVVLISDKNAKIYQKSVGLANYETNKPFSDRTAFKIGEISELVTSELINELAPKGTIQLTDKVSKYIPEVKGGFIIKDLLTHKTNLPTIAKIEEQNPNLKYSTLEFVNLVEGESNESGKSELNYNLLGLLIEVVTGKSFQENLLDFGKSRSLVNTYFQKSDSTQEATGYQFHNFRGKGLELQKSPTYDLDVAFSSRGVKSTADDLSKIIHANPERDVEINGFLADDGFSYSVFYKADEDLAIIVLSNRRHPVAKEISNAINSILKGRSYKVPLRRNPVNINPELLENYSGKYKLNEYVSFEVIREKDSLFVLLGPNKVALLPQSENQFYMLDNDASMRFEADSTNKVNSVVLLNGFIDSDEIAYRVEEE